MKRPARPLLSILLLAAFAAAFTCRTLVRRGLSPFDLDSQRTALVSAPVFNSTILKLAEVDLGETKFKEDTKRLVEGSFTGQSRYQTFATWRRVNRHVNGTSRPYMVRSGSALPFTIRSPRFYRYYLDFRMNLQNWARKKRFQDDIMLDLVRQVKHPVDRHNGIPVSDRKYSSCAVVGNSGILLNSTHGKLIDSHEAVIRLNNARISSFEGKVGSKTTISFVNSNILHLCLRRRGCFCHPYGPNVPILMYICQAVHFLDYTVCNSTQSSPLLVTDPRFDVLCSRIAKYYSLKRFLLIMGKSLEEWDKVHDGRNFHYSSGMQAVMLALGICDKCGAVVWPAQSKQGSECLTDSSSRSGAAKPPTW
ncbi:hypothetical protein SAY87_012983 [Trapa incisa]|uniref:Uncharacterized protein n=1 Tax=Trapa incisa TaxID=236973 RepID=A0AAN7KA54_9MYRT|nr:hypothetical protein SAY87_012983 [Trapa incisa]